MIRSDFTALMERHYEQIKGINTTKGKDYAGDDDALSNFKRQAANLGLTAEQIWGVYAGKHWDAVMSYCRHGQVESEPIEGRIHDCILYCFLLLGLIEEKQQEFTHELNAVNPAYLEQLTSPAHDLLSDSNA